MDTPVLAVRHVSKSFAGAVPGRQLTEIAPEKSIAWPGKWAVFTLIKVIFGVHTPEHGRSLIDGRGHAPDAGGRHRRGVRVIYQGFLDFLLEPSVMENTPGSEVAAGRRSVNRSACVRSRAKPWRSTAQPTRRAVGNRPWADKQLVAPAAPSWRRAKLVIMDEPTTVSRRSVASTSSATCSRGAS